MFSLYLTTLLFKLLTSSIPSMVLPLFQILGHFSNQNELQFGTNGVLLHYAIWYITGWKEHLPKENKSYLIWCLADLDVLLMTVYHLKQKQILHISWVSKLTQFYTVSFFFQNVNSYMQAINIADTEVILLNKSKLRREQWEQKILRSQLL